MIQSIQNASLQMINQQAEAIGQSTAVVRLVAGLIFGSIGCFGALALSVSAITYSLPGVFLACSLMPVLSAHFVDKVQRDQANGIAPNFKLYTARFLSIYPVAVLIANIAFRVKFAQPVIAMCLGTMYVIPIIAMVAFAGLSVSLLQKSLSQPQQNLEENA